MRPNVGLCSTPRPILPPLVPETRLTWYKLYSLNRHSFLATGAHHGYTTTLGSLHDGLAIDLGQFNTVKIDSSAATVTIGGATDAGDILDPLYDAGFQLQIGSCSCPGLVGVTLGAGVGRYQGVYGLLIDALVSVRLVTADGQLIEVSESTNSDLFWGIRGAGANFGIITSATFNIHPLLNDGQVMNVDFIFPADMSSAYFNALQSFDGSMPEELASITLIEYNGTTDAPQIVANWVYLGPEDEGREALAPIFDLNPPVADVTIVAWNKLLYTSGWGFDAVVCEKNETRDLYSTSVRSLSASTYDVAFEKMTTFFADYPNARYSSVEFEIFPIQATLAVPNDETAYPWRDSLGYISMSFSGWTDGDVTTPKAAEAIALELRDDFALTSGYPDLTVYVNYAHGDEKLEQIYGADKLPRLAALKKTWDPDNVFAYNNALPTEYP